MSYNPFLYKVGETDLIGFRLQDEKGYKDLSGLTIKFVIKDPNSSTPITMNTQAGSYVKGVNYTLQQGGVSAIITSNATIAVGTFESELVVTDGQGNEAHWPSASQNGDEFIPFIVHKSLNH